MFLIKSADQAHRTPLVRADAAVPLRFTRGGSAALAVLLLVGAAAAQEPSPAQRDAIKANCRSDFMSYCASVSPGGKDAFLCLQQNMAKLSSGCKQAVGAVAAAAEPKPTAPNTPPAAAIAPSPPPATTSAPPPAANAAPNGPVAAPSAAATPPLNTKPMASSPATPTAKQRTKPSPSATPVAAPPAPPSSPAPAVAAAPAAPPPPIPLREELFIVRNACAVEARRLCSDVQPGGGRIIACLRSNVASLSPRCQGALMAGR